MRRPRRTLLVVGSLSDFVGRRPVILAGLATGAISCGSFLTADGVGALFAGRALQGVAVGLISAAASAALVDLRPGSTTAPLVSSAAPTGGQALGAMGTSVPHGARGAFVVAVPCLLAVWALAGFYLSLGPSLAALLLHSHDLVWGGVLILLFTGLAAAASAALVRAQPTRVMLGGCLVLIAGALVTFTAIGTGRPALLFAGTAVAGLGFGPAFMGAYRAVVAQASPGDRAGLVTAIYLVSYLATGIPAVIGGVATSHYGLPGTALVYSLIVAMLAAAAVILLVGRFRVAGRAGRVTDHHPAAPPGPGTVPPCPPA